LDKSIQNNHNRIHRPHDRTQLDNLLQHCRLNGTIDLFRTTLGLQTPLMVLDIDQVDINVAQIRQALPGVELWYALKCNPHPDILRRMNELTVGFEVASPSEVDQLLSLKVDVERMMCLHPIKSPGFLRQLHNLGIDTLAVDCREEIEKIAVYAPGSKVVVRVDVPSAGSRVPLVKKFGCPADTQVLELFRIASAQGLRPSGLTMHIGSQCESADNWLNALQVVKNLCEWIEAQFPLELISLGGGLPVPYSREVPALGDFGKVWRDFDWLAAQQANCRFSIEPGRALAASVGSLITSVVGLAERNGINWCYLDTGVFHGLIESLPAAGGIQFPIESEHADRPLKTYQLAGPTCDSLDTMHGLYTLPELQVGDRLIFKLAGAYSQVLSTSFNGFATPQLVVLPTRSSPSKEGAAAHA
jgi:ornithine decarboxylase